jgi:membrane protein implicated in regulation of membrane protease activity
MNGKRFLASILLVVGIIFTLLTLISTYFFLISFIERQKYGPGLFFTDVEIFAFVTILFCILGIVSIYFSRRISKSNRK